MSSTVSTTSIPQLLRDRRWGPIAVGNVLGLVGFWNFSIIGAVLIQKQTGRVLMVALFTSLQFGFSLLISPITGRLFNRMGTRRSAAYSTAAVAIIAGAFAAMELAGATSVGLLLLGTTVVGISSAITTPALQVLMQERLSRDEVARAVVIQAGGMTIARAVGPAVAGLWLLVGVPVGGFLTFCLGYLVLVLAIIFSRSTPAVGRPSSRTARGRVLAVITTHPDRVAITTFLAATFVVAWGTDPVNTLLPALTEVRGFGQVGVGRIASAFGVGAALATLVSARLISSMSAMRLAGTGLFILGIGIGAAGLADGLAVATAAMAVAGIGFVIAFTTITTRLQRWSGDDARYVMGIWSAAFIGGRLPASLVNGLVADAFGPITAMCLVGVAMGVAALLLFRRTHTDSATPSPHTKEPA